MVFVTDVPSCKNNQPLEGFHSIKNNNKLPMFAPEIGSIHSSSFRLKIVVPIIIGMALRTGRTDRNYENQVDFFIEIHFLLDDETIDTTIDVDVDEL